VAFDGITRDGSSDSDSSCGAGDEAGEGACTARCELRVLLVAFNDIGFGGGGVGTVSSEGAGGGAGAGLSSIVECFPVVQGGIARKSSNVKTRGLQHFHPLYDSQHPSYLQTHFVSSYLCVPRGTLAVPGGRHKLLLGL
jgi:hypothetical protein